MRKRRGRGNGPIMLNLSGRVALEAVDGKLCHGCKQSRRTNRYILSKNDTNWMRRFCKKCFKKWKEDPVNSTTQLAGIKPWWKRLFKSAQKQLILFNSPPRGGSYD